MEQVQAWSKVYYYEPEPEEEEYVPWTPLCATCAKCGYGYTHHAPSKTMGFMICTGTVSICRQVARN